MKSLDRVALISFNGYPAALDYVMVHENYWQLIGEVGTVVDSNQNGEYRSNDGFSGVLVVFDVDLDGYGLANHNTNKNALWLRISDLHAAK